MILTVEAAAERLGTSLSNIYQMLARGTLVAATVEAKPIRGVVADGELWQRACKRRGVEPDPPATDRFAFHFPIGKRNEKRSDAAPDDPFEGEDE